MAQDGRVTRTSHGMAGRLYKRLVILPVQREPPKPAICIVEVIFTRHKDKQDFIVNRWTFSEPDRARQHFKNMDF